MTDKELMRRAIALSIDSVKSGGGPFGAVIARDGEVIAEGSNSVTIDNDPTAHAEVNTIRKACKKLGTLRPHQDASSTHPVNRVRCVSEQSTGLTSTRFTLPTTGRMPLPSTSTTTSSTRDSPPGVPPPESLSEILLRDEAIKAFQLWQQKVDKTEY